MRSVKHANRSITEDPLQCISIYIISTLLQRIDMKDWRRYAASHLLVDSITGLLVCCRPVLAVY